VFHPAPDTPKGRRYSGVAVAPQLQEASGGEQHASGRDTRKTVRGGPGAGARESQRGFGRSKPPADDVEQVGTHTGSVTPPQKHPWSGADPADHGDPHRWGEAS
jgi:hypothetical protein